MLSRSTGSKNHGSWAVSTASCSSSRTTASASFGNWLGALSDKLGIPITEGKLSSVTVEDVKALLQGDDVVDPALAREQIKAAVRCLWGEERTDPDMPSPQPYAEGDMPGSLRVAIASNHADRLDGHFGSCARFLIYQVARRQARLVAVRSTLDTDDAPDKNVARAALIGDCHLAYVQSIGGPAAAKLVRAGVHPVKLPEGGAADDALMRLQAIMDAPPPWLAKIMGMAPASLQRFMDDAET